MKIPFLFAMLLFSSGAFAHEYRFGDLHIVHPHATATPPGAATGSASLSIENAGKSDEVLLGARAAIAQSVEIHHMSMDGDMMRMRPLGNGVTIPAGKKVDFASVGDHLMLIGLSKPLVAGDLVPVTLNFKKAGEVNIELHVEPLQASDMNDNMR